MKNFLLGVLAALAVLATGPALAAEPSTMTPSSGNHAFMTAVPSDGYTVKDWYKQNVYDPHDCLNTATRRKGEVERGERRTIDFEP